MQALARLKFSPIITQHFQRNERSQALSGRLSVGSIDRTGARIEAQRTPAENLLWQLLRNRQLQGFKFRRQHQFGGYVADFYCRKACLVVECDGSAHNSDGQWQHDQVRDAYMLSQGLRVLRFSNDQILNDTENVLREIAEYLVPSDQKPSN
jgi:very-short-patch-repair endonuclease